MPHVFAASVAAGRLRGQVALPLPATELAGHERRQAAAETSAGEALCGAALLIPEHCMEYEMICCGNQRTVNKQQWAVHDDCPQRNVRAARLFSCCFWGSGVPAFNRVYLYASA